MTSGMSGAASRGFKAARAERTVSKSGYSAVAKKQIPHRKAEGWTPGYSGGVAIKIAHVESGNSEQFRGVFGRQRGDIQNMPEDSTPQICCDGRGIAAEGVIREIQRVGEKVDGRPTTDDFKEHGSYTLSPVYTKFGSWRTAVRMSGFPEDSDPRTHDSEGNVYSEDELLDGIKELAEDLDETPTYEQMCSEGRFGGAVYYKRFDSWAEAVEKAGLELVGTSGDGNEISDAQLLEEIQRLHDKLDGVPVSSEMDEHGKFAANTYIERFDGWIDALREAGFNVAQNGRSSILFKRSVGDLIDEMLRVAEIVDRPPTQLDMREHGDYSDSTYKRVFGTWAESLQYAGLPPRYKTTPDELIRSADHSYGKNWREKRQEAVVRDRHKCQHCGLSEQEHRDRFGKGLEVHHIVPIRRFDTPEKANILDNLITLCRPCHDLWEGTTGTDVEVSQLTSEVESR